MIQDPEPPLIQPQSPAPDTPFLQFFGGGDSDTHEASSLTQTAFASIARIKAIGTRVAMPVVLISQVVLLVAVIRIHTVVSQDRGFPT